MLMIIFKIWSIGVLIKMLDLVFSANIEVLLELYQEKHGTDISKNFILLSLLITALIWPIMLLIEILRKITGLIKKI